MTEKPRETQAESHVVELKEKVNNSSLMKHRTLVPRSQCPTLETMVPSWTWRTSITKLLGTSVANPEQLLKLLWSGLYEMFLKWCPESRNEGRTVPCVCSTKIEDQPKPLTSHSGSRLTCPHEWDHPLS